MKNFRKRVMTVLLAAVCAAFLTACEGRDQNTDSESLQTETGRAANVETETQIKEGAPVSMGRYMETVYPLPEGASDIGRSLGLLSDGGLAYFDGDTGLWSSADEGKTWENVWEIEESILAEGYVDKAAIASDQSVAMCLLASDGNGIQAKVGWVDPEGNLILAEGSFGDNDWVTGVFFKGPEELYAVTLKGKVLRFDREAEELKQLFIAADQPQVLAFSGKKLLALENDGVEIYDTEQGILTDSDPVLDDYCRENISGKLNNTSGSVGGILLDAGEGVIYLAYDGGVYRHVLGGNALEQVIDGSFSTFGDPTVGICDMELLPSGDFLLLTTGEEIIRFSYDPNEPTVPEIQLKVYSLEDNNRLRQVISLYQKQNPDVYVSYETGLSEGSAVTASDALKNLNVELMSGNGPDVILMDGIDVSVYADKGMLRDLSGLLDSLTGEDEVFANIAGYAKSEKGTFVVPAAYQIPLICGKKEDIDRVSDLESLADVVEELRSRQPDGSVTGCYSAQQTLAQLMPLSETTFLDGRQLDLEAVTEFLTQAKRIYDADQAGITTYQREGYGEYGGMRSVGSVAAFLGTGQTGIAFGLAYNMLADLGALEELDGLGYDFSLMPGSDGAGFIPVSQVAIAANSTRTELAEEFAALLLSYESQKVDIYDGFPVNIKAMDEICEGVGKNSGSIVNSWELEDGTRAEFGFEYPSGEFTGRFREMVTQVSYNLQGNAIVKEAVVKYGAQALEGIQELDDAVKDIQKAVAIYLAE